MKIAALNNHPSLPKSLRSSKGPQGPVDPADRFELSPARGIATMASGAVGLIGGIGLARVLSTPGAFDASALLNVSLRPDSLVGWVGGLAGAAVMALGAYHLTGKRPDSDSEAPEPTPAQRIWTYNAAAVGCISGGIGGAALLGALGRATGMPQVEAVGWGLGAGLGATIGAVGGYRSLQ